MILYCRSPYEILVSVSGVTSTKFSNIAVLLMRFVVSAMRMLVDVLKVVKTRNGEILAEYSDGCIIMYVTGIEYIKWLGAEKMVSDIKGEVM